MTSKQSWNKATEELASRVAEQRKRFFGSANLLVAEQNVASRFRRAYDNKYPSAYLKIVNSRQAAANLGAETLVQAAQNGLSIAQSYVDEDGASSLEEELEKLQDSLIELAEDLEKLGNASVG